jgi:hypothetical protein
MEESRMSSGADAIGNPWVTIWTKPRATIRGIVDHDVSYHVTFLAVVSGALISLERQWSLPPSFAAFPLVVVLAVIGGAIGGLIELYANGVLLKWAGARLGGVATAAEVRAALAWSRVPIVAAVSIGILSILIGSGGPVAEDGSQSSLSVLTLDGVLGLWAFVVTLKCVGEVHRFSAWRALASILLIAVAIVLLILATIILFGVVAKIVHPELTL